jgi:menaquinone-dependent protoporphyrinogen oxidase
MRILVAYASMHGATQGIAERIAERMSAAGVDATAQPVSAAGDLAGYDAFVIGSAAYIGHWQKEATEFVRRNQAVLAVRPTWLFSSGPLGTEPTDAQGRDQGAAAEPNEIAELREAIHPRDHRVFFGALNPRKLGFRNRAIRTLPAGRALLPEGDFRDWADIEAWASDIAHALAPRAAVTTPGV